MESALVSGLRLLRSRPAPPCQNSLVPPPTQRLVDKIKRDFEPARAVEVIERNPFPFRRAWLADQRGAYLW